MPKALTDLERCFRICFLMSPAMVPGREVLRAFLSSLPPPSVAVSSLSGLTRPEERFLGTHAGDSPEALAEAAAAAAATAAKDPEHLVQAAKAAASAILAAASPKRPVGGRGR